MPSEVPFFSYISLYIVSLQIINCNTKSSFHWKLRLEDGKVFGIKPNTLSADDKENDNRPRVNDLGHIYENEQHKIFKNDPELSDNIGDTVFNILVSTILQKGLWVKKDHGPCEKAPDKSVTETGTNGESNQNKVPETHNSNSPKEMYSAGDSNRLLCCSEVNYTEYDNLSGVANRHKHPNLPEPDVITFFQKKSTSKKEVNFKAIERRIRKALKEEPQNINSLQSAGNYWRVKGDTHKSIECFRKILKLQPNDKEALLSLGRILYHLGYLEDAAFLTRKSLELAQNHADAYLHHFTLGEILKAYGHYYEASLYFKQTLVLNPDYQPASDLLKDLQSLPETSVHAYTLFIIAFLVLAVLFGVLSTIEVVSRVSDDGCTFSSATAEVTKTQRHFNRAMAMRSMKLAVNSRPFRFKKSN